MDEQNMCMEHLWSDDRVKRDNQEKDQTMCYLFTTNST
jgi:hypothetical protein